MDDRDEHFIPQALELALRGVELGHGSPFGAIVVIDDRIVGQSWNRVIRLSDPSAHEEIPCIRGACEATDAFHIGSSHSPTCPNVTSASIQDFEIAKT